MLRRGIINVCVLCCAMTAAAATARAQTAVDVELVLAVDVSGSVSDERFALQQRGYAAAFRDSRLLQAIRSGATRSIAVTMTQWTGPAMQIQVLPWSVITDEGSMLAFADAIDKMPRQLFGGGTSISGAIDHAMTLFIRVNTRATGASSTYREMVPTIAVARLRMRGMKRSRRVSASTDCRFSCSNRFWTSTTGQT